MMRKSITFIAIILVSTLFGLRIEHVFGKSLSEVEGTFVFIFSNFQGCTKLFMIFFSLSDPVSKRFCNSKPESSANGRTSIYRHTLLCIK